MKKENKKVPGKSKKKERSEAKGPKDEGPKEEGTKWQEFLRRHNQTPKQN